VSPPEVPPLCSPPTLASVITEVLGGYALSEFGRLRPLPERRV